MKIEQCKVGQKVKVVQALAGLAAVGTLGRIEEVWDKGTEVRVRFPGILVMISVEAIEPV